MHVGPPPAIRATPMALRPGATPVAEPRCQDRDRPAGSKDPDPLEVAHGNRLNQCAASPAPATTIRSAAAANHWVTSRCSVVYPIREPRLS